MGIGTRIAERRQALTLSQADLAAEVGVAAPTVSRWEAETSTVKSRHLQALARALRCAESWLLSGEAPVAPPSSMEAWRQYLEILPDDVREVLGRWQGLSPADRRLVRDLLRRLSPEWDAALDAAHDAPWTTDAP